MPRRCAGRPDAGRRRSLEWPRCWPRRRAPRADGAGACRGRHRAEPLRDTGRASAVAADRALAPRSPTSTLGGVYTHFAAAERRDKGIGPRADRLFNRDAGCLAARRGALVPPPRRQQRGEPGFARGASRPGALRHRPLRLPPAGLRVDPRGLAPRSPLQTRWSAWRPFPPERESATITPTIPRGPTCWAGPARLCRRLPRLLSNRGYMLVGGRRCPIVGGICMDQLYSTLRCRQT